MAPWATVSLRIPQLPKEGAPIAESQAAADTTAGALDAGGSGDYSETNVQVEGVDEGDIVKTDGAYIYVLRDDELVIFRADGASTNRVSTTKVSSGWSDETFDDEYQACDYASDIYVSGDTAVVVLSRYSYILYEEPIGMTALNPILLNPMASTNRSPCCVYTIYPTAPLPC